MSAPAIISTRVPQVGDGIVALLARIAAGPIDGVALASAARNSTTTSATIDTNGYKGIILYLDMTVYGGAGGI